MNDCEPKLKVSKVKKTPPQSQCNATSANDDYLAIINTLTTTVTIATYLALC